MKDKKTATTQQANIPLATAKKDKRVLLLLALLALITVFATYWNHFDNSFHFDDHHTIVENAYIRDVKANYKQYFTDAKTLTPLPANQSYRPMITLSYGIDYWISYKLGHGLGDKLTELEKAGKNNTEEYKKLSEEAAVSKYVVKKGDQPKPFVYHCSNFVVFLLQGILMFFFIAKVFDQTAPNRFNRFFALFATTWYMLHTAIAETMNYICARSDSYSTMLVIMSFVVFQYSRVGRKYLLYLIPMIISILVKPPGLMFAPLLIVYVVLIEQQISLFDIFKMETWKKLTKMQVLLVTLVPLIIAGLGYKYITDKTPDTFIPSNTPVYNYVITQPYVAFQYFKTFFVPSHLSADSDLAAFESIKESKGLFWVGMAFVLSLLALAVYCTRTRQLRPIAFGIFWFFLALLPSSSIIPFAEVINDHRMYFPFVGLMVSAVWAIILLFRRYESTILTSSSAKTAFLTIGLVILAGHAYGTVKRCEVWNDDESLWYDVTIKSPKNGRGLMNYALTQYNKSFKELANGNKKGSLELLYRALDYYKKGLEFTPYYAYLHINIALVYDQIGKQQGNPAQYAPVAEDHFKKAQQYGGNYYGSYYYYANWLWANNRKQDAIWNAEQALRYGPEYETTYTTLMGFYMAEYEWEKIRNVANQMLQKFPGNQYAQYYLQASQNRKSRIDELLETVKVKPTPENYLTLSLEYYNKGLYTECIGACEQALKLNPNFADAYNNICSSYNQMGNYDKAIEAGQKAVSLRPDYSLAKGNLNYAIDMKKQETQLQTAPTAEGYLNAGLRFHNQKQYAKAADYYQKSIGVNPNYALAYNNLCSVYNDMGQYDKAVPYGEKAVKLDPANQLFKNNLTVAKNKGHL